MLISHEIPKQLFPVHDLISDYPYVLGHLISKDKEYADFYKKKLVESKYSILDNSCFELGRSIDSVELYNLALEYKPKALVLPDVLHDKETTLEQSINFFSQYNKQLKEYDIQCMGVLQGDNFKELIECFDQYIKYKIPYIAIPFDCIKNSDWHSIRTIFFKYLLNAQSNELIKCKIHFLGITNPSELLLYSEEEKSLIYSIDTSSPIINGWIGNRYGEYGLSTLKPKDKLADNLDIKLNTDQLELITYNIKKFKEYATR